MKNNKSFIQIIKIISISCGVIFGLSACAQSEEELFVREEPMVTITTPAESTDPVEEKIIVEIKGQVLKPGVYTLKTNQRLNDLVNVSGGVTKEANLRFVNLAMKIMDGDSFYIPSITEEETGEITAQNSGGIASLGDGKSDGKIDLNNASKEELMTVTGIGPATADNILMYREENGPFKSVDGLLQVNRIGEKTLDKIRDSFFVR